MLRNLQGRALAAGITVACGFGFLLFGYDQGVYGGLLTNPHFLAEFDNPNSTIQAQIVSTYYLGCILGAVVSNFIGDRIGRKRAVLLGSAIITIGGAIQAASFGLPEMLCGRIIAGIGCGLNTTAIPMWSVEVEVNKKHWRSRLVVLELVLNILGIVITSWLNFGFTYGPDSSVTWRFPVAFQCFFSIGTLLSASSMPESPRWLVMKDRADEARDVIARLLAKASNAPEVNMYLGEVVETVKREMEEPTVTIRDFTSGGRQHNLRRILLGCGVAFMQQMSGTNLIATYFPVLLTRSVGLSNRMALIISACNNIWLMIWGSLAVLVIDSLGRKKIMIIGAFAQSISFFMVAVGVRIGTSSMSIFAIVFMFVYYAFYGLAFLAIPWLYPAEINSQRMRNIGTSASTTTNWLWVYIIVLFTPNGIDNLGWRFYLIFGVFNLSFIPLVWFFYVETAKLSLDQIDRVFEIKSDGGSAMTWAESRRLALEERAMPHSKKAKQQSSENVETL